MIQAQIPNVVLQSLICDAHDLRRAIPANIQRRPKDNDGTEFTIGQLLDDLIETLESYEVQEGSAK
jgi:hypothetical protein